MWPSAFFSILWNNSFISYAQEDSFICPLVIRSQLPLSEDPDKKKRKKKEMHIKCTINESLNLYLLLCPELGAAGRME